MCKASKTDFMFTIKKQFCLWLRIHSKLWSHAIRVYGIISSLGEFSFNLVDILFKSNELSVTHLLYNENTRGAVAQRCSIKKVFLKLVKFKGTCRELVTPVPNSLFYKAAGLRSVTLLRKKTLSKAFSCELCELFTNTFL